MFKQQIYYYDLYFILNHFHFIKTYQNKLHKKCKWLIIIMMKIFKMHKIKINI